MSQLPKITVNVAQRPTPVETKNLFKWAEANLEQVLEVSLPSKAASHDVSQENLAALSLEIFQRPHVLSILTSAFSRGLTRDVAWDVTGIPDELVDCYLAAARVFKRGVPTINTSATNDSKKQIQPADKSYNVTFFDHVSDCLASIQVQDVVIVDSHVEQLWADKIFNTTYAVELSETEKNLTTLAKILGILRTHQRQPGAKNFEVYVIGGGVAGDLVGMACGLLGLRFHYVPTSLLAMVDSSVGGKVGVNFEPWGKNQLGLFYQPASVKICREWLKTLPKEEFGNGLAEAFKHALIRGDLSFWRDIKIVSQSGAEKINLDLLQKVIQVKCSVVTRDPEEQGERVVLNFGHTFGHAVEAVAMKLGIPAPHGECVAIGMIHALRLSKKYLGLQAEPFMEDLWASGIIGTAASKKLFASDPWILKLRAEILKLMISDKKSKADGKIRFVLFEKPGVIARDVDASWTKAFESDHAWRDIVETVAAISKHMN